MTQHTQPLRWVAPSSGAVDTDVAKPGSLSEARTVVNFWRDAGPKAWFAKNASFDAAFRAEFSDLHFAAARRERDHWLSDPYACLSLILLLDQFPRNAFRGTSHMYATDSLARCYARAAVNFKHVKHLEEVLRPFVFLPFMHSEDLTDQRYCVDLYRSYAPANLEYAMQHCKIIERFGRFPHRNAELGRATTPDEQQYLDGGGFSG
ncbi:MAG: DUF924 family protein [Candidimonas sp.]|nr:MAG: DUF924 family protein [Candidimonas sp.]